MSCCVVLYKLAHLVCFYVVIVYIYQCVNLDFSVTSIRWYLELILW